MTILISYLLLSFHFAQQIFGKFPYQIIFWDYGLLRREAWLPIGGGIRA